MKYTRMEYIRMEYTSLYFVALAVALPFLGGCGKQGAFEKADLSSLEQGFESRQTVDNVSVTVKQLTPKDREYVFGQKNLSFSPVLMTVENKSEEDLFFDTKKQVFELIDVRVNDRTLRGASLVGGIVISAAAAGVGVGLFGCSSYLCWVGLFQGFPEMILGGLCGIACAVVLIVPGIVGYKKCTKYKRAEKAFHFLSQPSYVIKSNGKESILLFFEKDNVPTLLPITLELQTKPAKTLAFELSTNRASQASEFIYKTV